VTELILELVNAGPSAHDKSIVGGENSDDIDTLGLDLIVLLDVAREMVRVAYWREGTGNGEEDDILALPGGRGELLGNTARELDAEGDMGLDEARKE
jgi:hypothetical protein